MLETINQLKSSLDYALDYANLGFSVFPIPSGKKYPKVRWTKVATTDHQRIEAWFGKCPDYSIGIDCGRSNLVVIDADVKNDGLGNLGSLIAEIPEFRYAPKVKTGGGGLHYYFAAPAEREVKSSAGQIAPGIDVRAVGGFIVAPPSLHESGERYEWEIPLSVGLPILPDRLLQLATAKNAASKSPDRAKATKQWLCVDQRVPKGQRNGYFTALAGTQRYFGVGFDTTLCALKGIRDGLCDEPESFPDSELEAIVKSVWSYPIRLDLYALAKIWRQHELSGSELSVLLNIAMDQLSGIKRPSMRRLANTTGLNKNTIYAARASLEEKGLLEIVRGKGGTVTATYKLLSPETHPKSKDIIKTRERVEEVVAQMKAVAEENGAASGPQTTACQVTGEAQTLSAHA